MEFDPPGWLEAVAWAALAIVFASAAYVLYDIYGRGYRQRMRVMEAVYPINALYWGPAAIWFYLRYGRRMATRRGEEPAAGERGGGDRGDSDDEPLRWWQVAKGVAHCGGGCTLGDIVAEWLVLAAGWTIAGKALYADFPADFVAAWTIGIAFQYFAIVPMRGLSPLRGIWAAIKADTLSILAFQVGLFFGMWLYQEVIFPDPLPKTTATYWVCMALAMILGFFTAYPANAWLIKVGWKERM